MTGHHFGVPIRLNHIVWKCKFCAPVILTHASSYDIALLATMTMNYHKIISAGGCKGTKCCTKVDKTFLWLLFITAEALQTYRKCTYCLKKCTGLLGWWLGQVKFSGGNLWAGEESTFHDWKVQTRTQSEVYNLLQRRCILNSSEDIKSTLFYLLWNYVYLHLQEV